MPLVIASKITIMSKQFDQEVEKSRILIYGVSGNTEIKERIAPIYTEERIAHGIELYQNTYNAGKGQTTEQDESKAATRLYNRLKGDVHERFMKTRKVVRYFYKQDAELLTNLKLNDEIPSNFAQWKTLVDITLSAIESRPEVKSKVALFGITEKFIANLKAELPKLDELRINAEKEDGEAQQATDHKNELFVELQSYCSDLRECLGLFFDGNESQKLEQVGIVVK